MAVINLVRRLGRGGEVDKALGYSILGLRANGHKVWSLSSKTYYDYCFSWGWRRLERYFASGSRCLMLEHGYIGDRFKNVAVTIDGLNNRGIFPDFYDDNRLERMFPNALKPWNPAGTYVLIIGQVRGDKSLQNKDLYKNWYADIASEAKDKYGLPVYFRQHPIDKVRHGIAKIEGLDSLGGDLKDALSAAALVITFNSNTGVDAMLSGKPVVVFDCGGMAYDIALNQMPVSLPEGEPSGRIEWAKRLACKQFTLQELRDGLPFVHLNL